jgi:putative transposase
MMTTRQLRRYFSNLSLPAQAQSFISMVRQLNGPASSRAVQRSAPGKFASAKMRSANSFEVRGTELLWVLALESDPFVLEYFLQHPHDKPSFGSENNQTSETLTAPYFFVLWTDGAGWADCLTDDQLAGFAGTHPGRYYRDTSGRWRCPVGEAFARPFGFCYRVLTPCQILLGSEVVGAPGSLTSAARGRSRLGECVGSPAGTAISSPQPPRCPTLSYAVQSRMLLGH